MKPKSKRKRVSCHIPVWPIFTAEQNEVGVRNVWFEAANEEQARAYCKTHGWTLIFVSNERAQIDGGCIRTIQMWSEERPERPLKVEVKYVKP